jgi:hypothetical protein
MGGESSCVEWESKAGSNFRLYRKPECIGQRVGVYSLGPNDSGIQPNASLSSDQAGDLFGTKWLVISGSNP